jgi:hypothetical protein
MKSAVSGQGRTVQKERSITVPIHIQTSYFAHARIRKPEHVINKERTSIFVPYPRMGCDGSSVFLSVKQLQDQTGIDCRLCRTPTKIPDKLASAPFSSPTTTTTGGTTQGAVSPWDEGGNSSGMTRGALIAVAVSAGTLLGGVLVVSARRFRRRRNFNNARGGTAIVIETVDVNKNASDIADGTSLGSDRQA